MKNIFFVGFGLAVACLLMLAFGPAYYAWVNSPDMWSGFTSQTWSFIGVEKPVENFVGAKNIVDYVFVGACLGAGLIAGLALYWASMVFLMFFVFACVAFFVTKMTVYVVIPAVVILVVSLAINYYTDGRLISAIKARIDSVKSNTDSFEDKLAKALKLKKA